MFETARSYAGMVVAPHRLAAEAGNAVLREGGNAVEAMIAAASTIAVVYPHMNSLGGDNFWLVHEPGREPMGIDACGAAAKGASRAFYRERDLDEIPARGPLAALTVPGAVSGWQRAYELSRDRLGGRMPLERLLVDATRHARDGIAVTRTQALNARAKLDQLKTQPGFAGLHLTHGEPPAEGSRFVQPALARTLEHLARAGLDDFYRGELAQGLAADLRDAGSPLALPDFNRHYAVDVTPLSVNVAAHRVYNMPPPTQGLASLMILALYARLNVAHAETFDYVHGLVESTKAAFGVRDRYVTDPRFMSVDAATFLAPATLDETAGSIDAERAAPWPDAASAGDTVWLGAVDGHGRAVSFIQSIYWEYGSGVVAPGSGIVMQNRGTSFSLDPAHHNCLEPLRRPFHTIQPALALLADGRVMAYGTMGGEGQPQTQAMLYTRHIMHGQSLQAAVNAPRWLLGRTWGEAHTNLRMESRFPAALYEQLSRAGHDVVIIGEYDEVMGHAGALVHHPHGLIEGAADPRGDGAACGF
ncbi:MAG: gamma-glutamyltransferase family protein [Gammaproteobacteria bacterium]